MRNRSPGARADHAVRPRILREAGVICQREEGNRRWTSLHRAILDRSPMRGCTRGPLGHLVDRRYESAKKGFPISGTTIPMHPDDPLRMARAIGSGRYPAYGPLSGRGRRPPGRRWGRRSAPATRSTATPRPAVPHRAGSVFLESFPTPRRRSLAAEVGVWLAFGRVPCSRADPGP